jgi:hypothetical protein
MQKFDTHTYYGARTQTYFVKFNSLLTMALYQLQKLNNVKRGGKTIVKTGGIRICKGLAIDGGAYDQEGRLCALKLKLQRTS